MTESEVSIRQTAVDGTVRLHLPELGAPARAMLETSVIDVVERALSAGAVRVEAMVSAEDRAGIRAVQRAGLRREGVLRDAGRSLSDDPVDVVSLARVAGDPPLSDPLTFNRMLNASLPIKRAIGQALIRNSRGEVLLCQLSYKKFWDLPGGVVDPHESPAAAVRREVKEELDVTIALHGLAAVTWLPPWRGWDDAVLFLFDARLDPADEAAIHLEPREIQSLHWCDDAAIKQHAAAYTARLIEQAVHAVDSGAGPVYLEDGELPDWS
ncbi:ADP-ribose pyrophosphatase YjhB (NUDIX family) [Branchiibius hedensis]|uniref:ADP-ribose pyrophosphatase YjhB, NUDIX family n=1 Tax=Branchiibius hedensis TaxID=672460 RepID=A0A2Y8ZX45_9MICO|nr:NUDIX hydrolase [Branchiibius hedensis]PWJ27295.1 ADP-ribose pyrophosphatase YjhB (NUDIX family) [Branchiibius hedensis]SSA36106.1 ADP-ribose pyrophosphatase YjhB, NUDIX family [Branchiibius hedensis]